MTKKNEKTITITIERRVLRAMFAGGNHGGRLAEGMKANLLEHTIWFAGLLHDVHQNDERFSDPKHDFYEAMLFEQAQKLIEAVEEAESEGPNDSEEGDTCEALAGMVTGDGKEAAE